MSVFGGAAADSVVDLLDASSDSEEAIDSQAAARRRSVEEPNADVRDDAIGFFLDVWRRQYPQALVLGERTLNALGYGPVTYVMPSPQAFLARKVGRGRTIGDFLSDSQQYLLVLPFNVGMHWEVIVADKRNNTVVLLDSLQHEQRLEGNDVLALVASALGPAWHTLAPKLELQTDDKSCGIFVILYVERALETHAPISVDTFQNILGGKTITEQRKRLASMM